MFGTMKKKLTIEIEMSCGEVPDHIVEDGIKEIINSIKFQTDTIKYNGYSNILHDYLSCDPYKEHYAELNISYNEKETI